MISDGPYGPTVLYSDGSTEHLLVDDVEPPALVADITFEESRVGFEVWFSERLVHDHIELIEVFTDWLREQPEVISVVHDDLEVVMVGGPLSKPLKAAVSAWWASRVGGVEVAD